MFIITLWHLHVKKEKGKKKKQKKNDGSARQGQGQPSARPRPIGQSEGSERSLPFTVANPAAPYYGKRVNPATAIQPPGARRVKRLLSLLAALAAAANQKAGWGRRRWGWAPAMKGNKQS